MKEYIKKQMYESYDLKQAICENESILELILLIAKDIIGAYKRGKKVLIAGNGGSAADAQHLAGELVNRFYFDRPGLPCIALTTDTSVLTAISNDYSLEKVFARQIQANGSVGDVFIGISTSGNSSNIIEALKECKKMQITTVGFSGLTGGKMKDLCDYCINVPSNITPRIQEIHILIGHIICALIEEQIFGKGFE